MRRLVMVACAALFFVPMIMKSRTSQDIPDRAAFRVLSSGRISVKINGDVRHPGIYRVSAKSLAEDVIIMAGPYRPLNSTKNSPANPLLHNASTVTFLLLPDGLYSIKCGVMAVYERLVLGISLDIESMTEADFERLPGVGAALAKRIVEYRQDNGGVLRVEDLKMVEGVGDKKYQLLHPYFQRAVNTE